MAAPVHHTVDFSGLWPLGPTTYVLGILLLGLTAGMLVVRRYHISIAKKKTKSTLPDHKEPMIIPLEEFDWEKTEPLQFRPFQGKDKYNLTMALENLNPSDLIQIDKTYKDRIALRISLLERHHDIVIAVNNDQDLRVQSAVSELYTFVLGKYLPTRYPSMFQVKLEDSLFQNLVTGDTWPTSLSSKTSTIQALEILTQTVDEDFLILLPELSPKDNDQPKYVLQAYTTCFPSGFNPHKKLGLRLADIHGPVPGYHDKLERSMDRFFARIEVGKYVKRVNWSITIDTELFAAFGGTHAVSGEKEEAIEPGKLKVDQTVLRCERQTLHRLPVSKALVFAIHTYTYPISQIKEEGFGEDLANAVDGLKKGNVPDMHAYKRGDVWGDALKEYLKG